MKTLRGKLTCIITIGIGIVLSIGLVIINNITFKNMEEEIKNEMAIIADYTTNNIKTIITTGNEDTLFTQLSEITKLFSCYILFKGNNIENYAGKYVEKEMLEKYKKRLENNFENEIKITLSIDKKDNLFLGTLISPIYIDKNFKGGFIIQKSYQEKYSSYIYLRNTLLITQSVLMGMLIIVLYFAIKKNTKELEALAYDIKAFGRGEKIKEKRLKRKDEIGILRNEFTIMEKNISILQNESKEFFARATHELKTPLTAIKGYSELLIDEDFEDEFIITAVERINEEGSKMKMLIENLLTIAREEEKVNVYKENINLKIEINNILKSLEIVINDKGLVIEKIIEIDEIEGFKGDFRILLNNLITNAIKYTLDRKVYIEAFKNEKEFVFKIKNKFLGENILNKDIFKPFIKNESFTGEIGSSGLGLYICKRICERNSWNIEYEIIESQIQFILKIEE